MRGLIQLYTLIGIVSLGFVALEAADLSIDATIAKIQSAPPAERVELMNAFKMRVANMNEMERMAAIRELQHSMQHNAQLHIPTQTTQPPAAIQEHATIMQLQANEEIHHIESMSQDRSGDQLIHETVNVNIALPQRVDTEVDHGVETSTVTGVRPQGTPNNPTAEVAHIPTAEPPIGGATPPQDTEVIPTQTVPQQPQQQTVVFQTAEPTPTVPQQVPTTQPASVAPTTTTEVMPSMPEMHHMAR